MAANKTKSTKTEKSSVTKKTEKSSAPTKCGSIRALFNNAKIVTFDAVKKASGYEKDKDVMHIMRRLRNRQVSFITTFDPDTRSFSLTK